ncbi:DUF6537 domain-containing protein, partial [Enterococcus faecium]|uniref:DUF6537 domain-containing protein n=1 Tax=Enterococcus faecium TaxID=1352 RepID=UPI003F43EC8F
WMGRSFALLARFRALRGTPLDVFGYSAHRRMERGLIREYMALVDEVLGALKPANYEAADAVLAAHDMVRGYDVVKDASVARLREELPLRMAAFRAA